MASRQRVRAELNALACTPNVRSAVIAAAKGAIDETAPGFLGLYIGAVSSEFVRAGVEDADVIIGVGLRLADLSSGGFSARLDPARLIDIAPAHASVAGETVPGVPMGAALAALRRALACRGSLPASSPRAPVADAGKPIEQAQSAPLTQERFWERFGRFLRADDILVADQGTPFYGIVELPLPPGADVVAQPLWASIGYALPALTGAQLAADRTRRSILVTGDGSAQMTIQEIGTMIRHGLDPIIILINNDGYTVERAINGPRAHYNDIARWNWTAIPDAFGAAAGALVRRAETIAEFDEALRACEANTGQLSFIEVVMDRLDLPALLARMTDLIAGQDNRT